MGGVRGDETAQQMGDAARFTGIEGDKRRLITESGKEKIDGQFSGLPKMPRFHAGRFYTRHNLGYELRQQLGRRLS